MNRIKPVEDKDPTVWRRQSRRREDEDFNDWLSGPPPENTNRPGAGTPIPGDLAKTDLQAIIITQQQEERGNKRLIRGKSDPYAGAYSDARRDNSAHVGNQFSFAFIGEDEEGSEHTLDTEV